ncbi:MAG: PepSY domain-containing protein [Steroidobacteraceae bacterium]
MRTLALRRLHKWAALLVAVQLVLWTAGGCVFAWLDQREAAGQQRVAEPAPPRLATTTGILEPARVLRGFAGQRVLEFSLQTVADAWVYRIRFAERVELRRAADGAPFRVDARLVQALAQKIYRGEGRLAAVRYHPHMTLETRGEGASWEAAYEDAMHTRLYFAADDGRFIAARNDAWRLRDFFWMLHTMDYRGRDDFNHPLLVLAATAGVWVSLSGVLLVLRVFRRRQRQAR